MQGDFYEGVRTNVKEEFNIQAIAFNLQILCSQRNITKLHKASAF
jgi:hypothetical protein